MGLTFDQVVDRIIQHRAANPRYANQWSTERATVESELDEYTCLRIGNDPNYCAGSAPPFSQGQPQRWRLVPNGQSAKAVAGGAISLLKLFSSSQQPVEQSLAEARAAVCLTCPLNGTGDWMAMFTKPAAMFIRKTLSFIKDANLKTSLDKQLGICEACGCPNQLKVHVKLDFIKANTDTETMARFDPDCWIKNEADD